MKRLLILILLLPFVLHSCGGGGGSSKPPTDNVNPYIQMNPPVVWQDNTPLVPERDLKLWRIYALNLDNGASWFSDNNAVADVVLYNNGVVLTEFNLNLLRPYLDNGEYLIGVKVISLSDQLSDFADNTVLWENK